ncbi:hypothetical protein [Natronococcus occultus]|uniref:Uncharacterized protein n=1 Tax=Natronococcus occultus SP4 TaxID=694430 RepID=L0JUZ4_9EURY|nr:hypothetical protein [Natronococcus occultus]AGB36817.1 hypothetical protein Natoc_0969 [Natronococcus occultus SP4]
MTDRRLHRKLNAIVLLLVLLTGAVFGIATVFAPAALLAAGLGTVMIGAILIPYAMSSPDGNAEAEPSAE